MPSEIHPAGRHESSDADITGIVKSGVALFIVIVLALLAMRLLFDHFSATQQLGPPASPFAESRTMPPQPRLQVRPAQDLKSLRQGEDDLLNSYGWVDQKTGLARIPIDRAMELLLAKGLPVRGQTPAKKAGSQ